LRQGVNSLNIMARVRKNAITHHQHRYVCLCVRRFVCPHGNNFAARARISLNF